MPETPKAPERDRQGPPPREGEPDALAGQEPDDIPMTGEEDPLAEVDQGDFGESVAEFAESERHPSRAPGSTRKA